MALKRREEEPEASRLRPTVCDMGQQDPVAERMRLDENSKLGLN